MRELNFNENTTDQEIYDLLGERIFFIRETQDGHEIVVGIIQTVVLTKNMNGYNYQVVFHLQGGELFNAVRGGGISTEFYILD